MAYIVIQRAGEARLYPLGLPVMWHLVWAVAEWSGLRNGFTSKAHAVVIRTRPDVIFTVPFSLRPLQHYFARGAHGAHLTLVQNSEDPPAQTDLFLVTSYRCYANDIAVRSPRRSL